MNLISLCSTRNLLLDEKFVPFYYNGKVLINHDTDLLNNFLDKTFSEFIGRISVVELKKKPFFSSVDKVAENIDPQIFNDFEIGDIQLFLFCLWFVKDNSVNTMTNYTYIPSKTGVVCTRRTTVFSNCSGEYQSEVFSSEELKIAHEYYIKVLSFSTNLIIEPNFTSKIEMGLINPGGLNHIIYNSTNKLEKCINYLQIARSNSLLPLKISFYMAVFESLFTTGKDELVHKIGVRVSLYLGGNKEEKMSTYSIIKNAYNVRSEFVHGQSLSNKNKYSEQLKRISFLVDNLLRDILKKILINDSDLFLGLDFKKYIEELVFD